VWEIEVNPSIFSPELRHGFVAQDTLGTGPFWGKVSRNPVAALAAALTRLKMGAWVIDDVKIFLRPSIHEDLLTLSFRECETART
jgi:hypothetical protein